MKPDPGLQPTRDIRQKISRELGNARVVWSSTTWTTSVGLRTDCDRHLVRTTSVMRPPNKPMQWTRLRRAADRRGVRRSRRA
jgi:hypothetical protein